MSLPLHKRYEIVFLHEHPNGPKLGYTAISKIVKCSRDTVGRWIKRWKETKDLSDEPKAGRPRCTTDKEDKQIVKLAEKVEALTCSDIHSAIEKKGINVSSSTVRRRIIEAEGKYSAPISKPLLTDNHREKRLQWAKKHINFDWNKVVFTDESTFLLNQPVKKVWNFSRRKKIIRTVKHPLKVHVWGCFSASGFGDLICFQRNLNADFMCTIYERGLLSSVNRLFGVDDDNWILQEDNDPKHRSKIAKSWKVENGIKELPWPSMSPDQNPIENVWRIMKIRISKKKIRTISGLKAELVKEWKSLPNELARNLVESMQRRITALIEANGDYTLY